MIGVAVVGLVLWGGASLFTSASLGVLLPWALPRLGRSAAVPRARTLALLLVAPGLAAALTLALSFGPCLENLARGLPDTCDRHGGPHIYLCLMRPAAPSVVAWVLGAALLVRVAYAVATLGRGVELTRRLARRLRRLAVSQTDNRFGAGGYLVVPGRVSFTAGCPRSDVFIGEELLGAVDEARLAVVLAHEAHHQRRHHVLLKLLARACSPFHLPYVGTRLTCELETALEEACDAEAARVVGDPFTVAESLVALARLEASSPPGAFAGFADQPDTLSRRVSALCRPAPPDGHRRSLPALLLTLGVVASLAMIAVDQHIHDAAEALLQLLGV